MALEEEWGLRAVAALGEPYPQPRNAFSSSRVATEEAEGEVVLLLACLCRGLGTTYVVRVPEILSRWGGGRRQGSRFGLISFLATDIVVRKGWGPCAIPFPGGTPAAVLLFS